ncbi:MAG: dicarboxylate/amino acid:cation symporter, partial [Stutzerimonas stutzeri]
MRVSLTVRILIGLALGLVIGIVIAAIDPPWRSGLLSVAQPIGHLWLQGLQMTIIPLVFALLVTGVASLAGQAALGGLPARAIALFAVLLLGAASLGAGVALLILTIAPPPEAAAEALRRGATGPVPQVPTLDNWLTSFIPANPIQAAAETQMVGLVIFALIFGLAAARIAPDRRAVLTGFFDAVADVMLTIVQWVLQLAPFGVFALAIGVGAGAGIAAAGALVNYVVVVVGAQVVLILATYLVVFALGRTSLGHFARGAAAPQV